MIALPRVVAFRSLALRRCVMTMELNGRRATATGTRAEARAACLAQLNAKEPKRV